MSMSWILTLAHGKGPVDCQNFSSIKERAKCGRKHSQQRGVEHVKCLLVYFCYFNVVFFSETVSELWGFFFLKRDL